MLSVEKGNMVQFTRYVGIALFVLALALYSQTITHDFAWDDQLVITQNTVTLQGLSGIKDIWTSYAYLEGREIYRPIPQTIHAILWELFPEQTIPFHAVQILVYALCCLSLLYLFRRMFPKMPPFVLWLSVLVFIFMPVHVEVVANIKSLDELLAALFSILAFIFIHPRTKKRRLFSLLFIVLALLSKISTITLIPLWVFGIFHQEINSAVQGIKPKLQNLNYPPIVSFVLLTSALFCFYELDSNLPGVYLSLAALPLILKTQNRHLRFVLFIAFSALLAFHYRWSYALLGFILLFNLEIVKSKTSKLETAIKFGIFALVSLSCGYVSINTVLALVILFTIFYLYHNKQPFIVKYIRHILFLIFAYSLFIGFTNQDYIFKPFALFIFLLSLLSTWQYKRSIQLKLLVILFSFITSEYAYYHRAYTSAFVATEITPNDSKGKNLEEITFVRPYHNVLFSSKTTHEKYLTIARIQLIYLQKLVFPTALVHQHGTWQIRLANWKDWDVYLSILIHVLLLALGVYFYKRKEYSVMWGIIWYFLTISIFSNIVRMLPDTMAERFLFLPSIGFSIALVSGLYFFIRKWLKNENKALITLVIVLLPLLSYYAYKTIDRNHDWENNYTLAANTLPYAQDNAAINAQYALELNNLVKYNLVENKDSAKAIVVKHYKKALNIFPDFYGPNADLANYYILEAKPDSAFQYLLAASRMKPEEWLHSYYLGLIYFERNKYSDALIYFDRIISNQTLQARANEFPELLEAYEFGARCLHNTGNDAKANDYLKEAISLYQQKSTYILQANLYRVTGKTALAIETFQELQALHPDDQEIANTIEYLKQGLIY